MKYNTKTEEFLQENFGSKNWNDYIWQEKNIFNGNNIEAISKILCLSEKEKNILIKNNNYVKIKLTPYLLYLIEENKNKGNLSIQNQFLNFSNMSGKSLFSSWDNSQNIKENLPVFNAQNKYENSRIIVRLTGTCPSFCQYCFEAVKTINKGSEYKNMSLIEFKKLCNYIEKHPEIEELILSGGDPLVLPNSVLKLYFKMIREIKGRKNNLIIRIHTRYLTFNPYRFDKEFISLCKKYNINSIGFHIVNQGEFTETLKDKIIEIRNKNPFINFHLNTPFLKGINDNFMELKELFIKARFLGIEVRYIYHTMKETPGKDKYYIPIKKAIRIMENFSINRSSNLRPNFVIASADGKFKPSLFGIRNFEYINNGTAIKYINWKGNETTYSD